MSNDNGSEDFQLEDLEKPLTEQEMKVAAGGAIAPGLYVQIVDGAINLSNSGGTSNFAAGQFGFPPSITQPPVLVPKNPGIKFTPPPVFTAPPSIPAQEPAPTLGLTGNNPDLIKKQINLEVR